VLSYVGPGHHFFVAPVSKPWRYLYATLKSQQLAVYDEFSSENISITCVSEMTLYSCLFKSPSRVKLAHESGLDNMSTAYLQAAGRHADVATLAAAHELGMQFTAVTMAAAALCNKVAEVQYLHSQGCYWPSWLLAKVVSKGYFELMRWCYEHCCRWIDVHVAPYYAAQGGSIELMAWVLQLPGAKPSAEAISAAASRGHTDMCKFLRSQQCPWDVNAALEAARKGHTEALRWLLSNRCPRDKLKLGKAAARGGSVDVLTCLQQQGLLTSIPLLTDMLDIAARNNKLAAAKWLRDQGAEWPDAFDRWRPWSDEVLAWARTEGCTTSLI
jgi:Ankyrin repeats (3 copies)